MVDKFGRPLFKDGDYPDGRMACASVIDLALAAPPSDDFYEIFVTYRFFSGAWGSALDQMSRDVRMLVMTAHFLWLWRKSWVDSVLRDEYFINHMAEWQMWFDQLGATRTACMVRDLMSLYPNKQPPVTPLERGLYIRDQIEARNPDVWKEICARYPALDRELAPLLRRVLQERGAAIGHDADKLRATLAAPLPLPLAEIVATSSDIDFEDALIGWLDAPRGNPALGFDHQPPTGTMLWVLCGLHTSVAVTGMTHFLKSWGVGCHLTRLSAWSKRIGATTTAAYARAASAELKRLNGGRLPSMADSRRIPALEQLEDEDQASGGTGLFDTIDDAFRDSMLKEFGPRLRAYVTANVASIEAEQLAAAAEFKARHVRPTPR